MFYDPSNRIGYDAAIARVNFFRQLGKCITIEGYNNTRTNKQNRALHKYYQLIADMLNEKGITFKVLDLYEAPFSVIIVKETIWKPIQKVLFDSDSTTKLTTNQINTILDVLANHFSELGEVVEFPCIENLM